jgi:hypothetical protein
VDQLVPKVLLVPQVLLEQQAQQVSVVWMAQQVLLELHQQFKDQQVLRE